MIRESTVSRFLMILSFCCAIPGWGINAQETSVTEPKPGLEYVVDLADVRNHYVSIELTVPVEADETELMMAVWTPGSYLVREYARHIDTLTITDPEGKPLVFDKTRKNRWTVQSKDLKSFTVRYRLYCNEMSVRTNWVGREFAMLNGAPTFMTVPERLDRSHTIRLEMPRKWTRSATSLRASGREAHEYEAENFDELVDSPIVAGNVNVYVFEAGGVQHQLVNVGESGYWDGTFAAKDLTRLVEAHQEMWGTVPYDRYLFLNVISGTGGGLEHDNSTLIMTSRWSFRDQRRYKDWLSLASHEFFHTWNVRRLRPRGLRTYDYENETYTPSLWVAEGITSYYEDLLLARAGLFSESEYLRRLNRTISSVQNSIGRKKQSLRESSYDTWIKFYRPDENSSNTRVSYYSKGAVVGFLLDARIREVTGGLKSLDDVMREMYQRFEKDGYTTEDFRNTVSRIAGKDMSDWFASAVDSTDDLDFVSVNDWFGLEFPGQAKKKDDLEEKDESKPKGSRWLGFSGTDSVSRVEADSPATEAGINTGDEIIAVNGFRVSGSLDSRIKQYEIGDTLDVMIARRGVIHNLKLTIGSKQSQSWNLKASKEQTVEQRGNMNAWLGIEEELEEDDEDGDDSEKAESESEDDG